MCRVYLVLNLAKKEVHKFAGERLIPRNTSGHTSKMVSDISEHCSEVGWLAKIPSAKLANVFDPLPKLWYIGEFSICDVALVIKNLLDI